MTSFLDEKLSGGVNEFDNFILIYYYDLNDDYNDSEVLMEFDDEDDIPDVEEPVDLAANDEIKNILLNA